LRTLLTAGVSRRLVRNFSEWRAFKRRIEKLWRFQQEERASPFQEEEEEEEDLYGDF